MQAKLFWLVATLANGVRQAMCFTDGGVVYSDGPGSLRRLADELGVPSGATVEVFSDMMDLKDKRGKSDEFSGSEGFCWRTVEPDED